MTFRILLEYFSMDENFTILRKTPNLIVEIYKLLYLILGFLANPFERNCQKVVATLFYRDLAGLARTFLNYIYYTYSTRQILVFTSGPG